MMIDLIGKINKCNERELTKKLQRKRKRKRDIRARQRQYQREHTQNQYKMIMVSGEEWLSSHSCAAQVS